MAPASDSSNEGVANEGGTSSTNGGDVGGGPTSIPLQKGSPPPYDHALYSNYNTANLLAGGQQAGGDLQIASFTNPTPATTSASYVGTTSFTNTFLRGILTSIDSKDPVVANAWLDTLLDAIDLLPPGEYLLKKFQLLIFEIRKNVSNHHFLKKSFSLQIHLLQSDIFGNINLTSLFWRFRKINSQQPKTRGPVEKA